jgi:hypothetical protein
VIKWSIGFPYPLRAYRNMSRSHWLRLAVAALAIGFAAPTFADRGGSTYRAGSKVLSPGDSAMRVLDAMGQPEVKEPAQNVNGASMGEYWYYRDGSKTVKFFISGGKIVNIEEIRN